MNTVLIAFRNISRQKKRSFLLAGAIAFGIMIITILNGFTTGAVANVKENFSQIMAGHIYISGNEQTESGKTISVLRDEALLKEIIADQDVDIKYITKRSNTGSTLIFNSKETRQRISGVNWSDESFLKERLSLKEGSFAGLSDPQAIILSISTAKKLGLEVGETVLARVETITGQRNVGEFKVVALNQDASIFGSMAAYVNLDYLNELLNMKAGEFQSMNIFLNDMNSMDSYADKLLAALEKKAPVYPREEEDDPEENSSRRGMGGMMGMGNFSPEEEESWEGTKYQITTLNDMMSQLMTLANVVNITGLVIFLFLLVIIGIGILNTFRMVLIERTREIGTIRAIGMQKNSVQQIFLLEALFTAAIGVIGGIILSLILMGGFSLINFGMNNTFFIFLNNGRFSLTPTAVSIILNIFFVAAISLLAAYFPARKAAKLDPAKALSSHY